MGSCCGLRNQGTELKVAQNTQKLSQQYLILKNEAEEYQRKIRRSEAKIEQLMGLARQLVLQIDKKSGELVRVLRQVVRFKRAIKKDGNALQICRKRLQDMEDYIRNKKIIGILQLGIKNPELQRDLDNLQTGLDQARIQRVTIDAMNARIEYDGKDSDEDEEVKKLLQALKTP